MNDKAQGKIRSLELGRFYAALLVVLFHNGGTVYNLTGSKPFNMLFRGGHSGVEYFFVLSGFIIMYVHRRDLGHADRIASFAEKRVIRLIPALWMIVIPWGLLKLLGPKVGTLEDVTPLGFLCELFLLPHGGGDVLGVLWTLRREVIFYLLFALAIANRRVGLTVLVGWQILVVVQMFTDFMIGIEPDMLLGTANLGFGAGMLIAWFMPRRPIAGGQIMLYGGIALFAGLMIAEWAMGGPVEGSYRAFGEDGSTLAYTAAAIIILLGMLSHDFGHPGETGRIAGLLGGSSYVLYLVHLPVASVSIRLLKPLWGIVPSEILLILLTVAGILASVAFHLWLEQPVMAYLKRRARSRMPESSSTAATT